MSLAPKLDKRLMLQQKVADWFKHYKPESKIIIRKSKVKENEVLKQLESIYKAYREGRRRWYEEALLLIKGIKYASKDVTEFSIMLPELIQNQEEFHHEAGTFLNALINNCEDKEFLIITEHLVEPIANIGYKNTKNIIVKGNSGDPLGQEMKGGKIIVEGDARSDVGREIEGGEIIIEGNAENYIGHLMKGGKIIVKGNVGQIVGESMRDGTIIIKGNARDRVGCGMGGGKIIVEGNARSDVGGRVVLADAVEGDIVTFFRKYGGEIIVKGNAGRNVGGYMAGGSIYIYGEYVSIGLDIRGGNIFHRTRQIIKDGKVLI